MAKYNLFTTKQVQIGNKRMKKFKTAFDTLGLSWQKFLCLRAGNCKKKTHLDEENGVWKDEMECEASLVGALDLHVQLSGLTEKNFNKMIDFVKKWKE